ASHDSLLSVRELWFPPGCYFARRNDTRQKTTNCPNEHVPVFRNANCSWQHRDASNRHFESIYIRQPNVMSILTEVDERGWCWRGRLFGDGHGFLPRRCFFDKIKSRRARCAARTSASKPEQKFSPIVHCDFATFKDA